MGHPSSLKKKLLKDAGEVPVLLRDAAAQGRDGARAAAVVTTYRPESQQGNDVTVGLGVVEDNLRVVQGKCLTRRIVDADHWGNSNASVQPQRLQLTERGGSRRNRIRPHRSGRDGVAVVHGHEVHDRDGSCVFHGTPDHVDGQVGEIRSAVKYATPV